MSIYTLAEKPSFKNLKLSTKQNRLTPLKPTTAMSVAAARSALRSTAVTRAAISGRIMGGLKPNARPATSPFRIFKRNPLSHRIFRSPVEMSCSVETMLPFHTATASALLTSMLSVSRRSYGWTLEDCNDDV